MPNHSSIASSMSPLNFFVTLGVIFPALATAVPARPRHDHTHLASDDGLDFVMATTVGSTIISHGSKPHTPRLSRRVYNGPTGGPPTPEDLKRIRQVEDLALLHDIPDAYERYEYCLDFVGGVGLLRFLFLQIISTSN